jgi:nitrogenase molybdenum-iron protein alpha chain
VAYGAFLLQGFKSRSLQNTMKAKTEDGYKDWYYEQDNPLVFLDTEEGV